MYTDKTGWVAKLEVIVTIIINQILIRKEEVVTTHTISGSALAFPTYRNDVGG